MSTDPYKYFRIEAREILEEIGRGVLDLEARVTRETVAKLLRAAHTLKGAARVVRQPEIAEHAHAIETALVPLRTEEEGSPFANAKDVLALVDAIATRVAALDAPTAAAAARPQQRRQRSAVETEMLRTVRMDVGELDAVIEALGEARRRLRTLRGRDNTDAIEQIDRELLQAREIADRMRLVPVESVFAGLERTAHDAARELSKAVVFQATGGDVRLEASVLAIVQGALVQLVRNAVAHGIEDADTRVRSGKPREGRVALAVKRVGQRVIVACEDDGRGIDLEAVRRAAAERGIDTSTGDVFSWLAAEGVTTSAAVSEVAGRGIGLDVVRDALARLGGEPIVRTEAGKGTSIELVTQISLSGFDALLVEAAGITAAIPLDAVRATTRLASASILRVVDGEQIVHDGVTVPFAPLARLFGRRSTTATTTTTTMTAKTVSVFHLDRAAVGVDRIVSVTNIVARPLPSLAVGDPIVSATSLDADGEPRLVLDPARLANAVRERRHAANDVRGGTTTTTSVLVIDDSLTTRMLEQSILESAGYEVELATSAEEGLEKARARTYQLFLVDVEMPGMDGYTFVAKTRADEVLSRTPAILVTSRGSPQDRQRGLDAGAKAYVVKSEFDQGALLETIRKLTGGP